MPITMLDDMIAFEISKSIFNRLRRFGRRWRQGLKPLWVACALAVVGTGLHLLLPELHWVFAVLSLSGAVVATSGEHIGGPLAKLAPTGLDAGEIGKLDGLAERAFVALLLWYAGTWLDNIVGSGWYDAAWYRLLFGLVLFGGIWYVNQRVRVVGKANKYVKRWPKLAREIKELEKSRVVRASSREATCRLLVDLPKGRTGSNVFGVKDNVASFYSLRPEAVQMHQDPDNARRVVVDIVLKDPWVAVLPHPLPPPGSLSVVESDVVAMGRDERGHTQDYQLQHTLVAGQAGSGKSAWIESLLAYVASFRDVAAIGIDMASGATLSPWDEVLLLPTATDVDVALDYLDRIIALMEDREREIAEKKKADPEAPDVFVASEDDPMVLVVIDEFPDLIAMGGQRAVTAMGRIMKRARKAGIRVIVGTQNGSKDDLGSKEAQGQFKATVSFYLDDHASRVLWKTLHNHGWSASSLKNGQYKIRDERHRVPTVYKGFFSTPQERAKHREMTKLSRPTLSERGWKALTGPIDRTRGDSLHPELLALFPNHEVVLQYKEIMQLLDKSRQTVYNWTKEMTEAGELVKVGHGWRLASDTEHKAQ